MTTNEEIIKDMIELAEMFIGNNKELFDMMEALKPLWYVEGNPQETQRLFGERLNQLLEMNERAGELLEEMENG